MGASGDTTVFFDCSFRFESCCPLPFLSPLLYRTAAKKESMGRGFFTSKIANFEVK
jgi:hypothetical protein